VISSRAVLRLSFMLLAASTAALAVEAPHEETPIPVPSAVPVGFLLAWRPMILSVRVDSGQGSRFGSDKAQLLRILGRYTTRLLDDKLLTRLEIEGGQFESDDEGARLGSNGYDVTGRVLFGGTNRLSSDLVIVASAGLLTRYQRGRAVGGAPSLGVFGVTSNIEFEVRLAPVITMSLFVEGGLTPFSYRAQSNLGNLSDASEARVRLQFGIDLTRQTSIDVGYDFTRWHASFTESRIFNNGGADQALLIEAREHVLTLGFRWKTEAMAR